MERKKSNTGDKKLIINQIRMLLLTQLRKNKKVSHGSSVQKMMKVTAVLVEPATVELNE